MKDGVQTEFDKKISYNETLALNMVEGKLPRQELSSSLENINEFNPLPYGGAFKVTKDLSNLFPLKVKNTPISEQAISGRTSS